MNTLVLVGKLYMDKDKVEIIECSLHSVKNAVTRDKRKKERKKE